MTPEDDTLGDYEILFSEPAEAELEVEYMRLAGVRFDLAERWNEGILTACQSLSQLPKRYPLAPDQVRGGYQTRRMPFRYDANPPKGYWESYYVTVVGKVGHVPVADLPKLLSPKPAIQVHSTKGKAP